MANAEAAYRMISIEVSQGCELARWLLERAGLPFVEELHAPLLHVLATLCVHGGIEAPVIVTGTTSWQSTAGILAGIDAHAPVGAKVFGETGPERIANQVFFRSLLPWFGPPLRMYVYHFVLPERRLMVPLATYGVPGWERLVVRWFYPLWRRLLARALGDTPAGFAAAPGIIEKGLALVDAELARRGTPFLSGDAPGGIDIVASAQMSPVIFPPQYGGKLPPIEAVAPELRAFVEAARARPAGRLALATYAAIRDKDTALAERKGTGDAG
jgi:glutathione S-transferase